MPGRVIIVGDVNARVVSDDVGVNGLDRLGVRLHPAHLGVKRFGCQGCLKIQPPNWVWPNLTYPVPAQVAHLAGELGVSAPRYRDVCDGGGEGGGEAHSWKRKRGFVRGGKRGKKSLVFILLCDSKKEKFYT